MKKLPFCQMARPTILTSRYYMIIPPACHNLSYKLLKSRIWWFKIRIILRKGRKVLRILFCHSRRVVNSLLSALFSVEVYGPHDRAVVKHHLPGRGFEGCCSQLLKLVSVSWEEPSEWISYYYQPFLFSGRGCLVRRTICSLQYIRELFDYLQRIFDHSGWCRNVLRCCDILYIILYETWDFYNLLALWKSSIFCKVSHHSYSCFGKFGRENSLCRNVPIRLKMQPYTLGNIPSGILWNINGVLHLNYKVGKRDA